MENWQYHDNKLKELKKIYNRVSKQTQNRLQEIFDTFHFSFKNLYNIADIKTKNRVNTYIEEWKEKGLLTEYFGMLANNIYRRTRVKNSEILELLIYGAYIEEQSKLNKTELNIIKDIANYYYIQGQEEVNNTLPNKKRKKVSVISDAIFLALLDMPNAKGYIWKQYIEAITKYNAEQVYRQATIDLQQQKELDITNNVYQNIINKQNNSKLSINNNKISGDIDLTILGINNQAKIKGIQSIDNNGKVVFLANLDGTETPMCHSLNNQEFYINKENVFDRYYGETPKLLSIRRIKCFGLVLGLNLPPINYHFHWCRSIVQYIPNKRNEILDKDKRFSIFDSKFEKEIKDKYNIRKLQTKHIDEELLKQILNNTKEIYKDFPQIRDKIKQIKEIEHDRAGMSIQPQKDNKYIMEINKKYFHSKEAAIKAYDKTVEMGIHPKGTTYKDMIIHELGHGVTYEIIRKINNNNARAIAFDWNNHITSNKTVNEAFKKLQVDDIIQKQMLIRNISKYSLTDRTETIGEAFCDYYANRDKASLLSKTIIDVMRGMI